MVGGEAVGCLLHQCSKLKALREGLSLHAVALKTGMLSDVIVSNHVVNMYSKCGDTFYARNLFDEMSFRNLVSWSAMISGYDQAGQSLLALNLFSQMRIQPNEFVFGSVISACASIPALPQGQQLHALSLKVGYGYVCFVSNALITMYMKCGRWDDAVLVHNESTEANTVSYNALISGFAENQQPEKGFGTFKLMHTQGLLPDKFTFAGVFGICTELNDIKNGAALHCQTIKFRLDVSEFVGNVIITMYSKFQLIEEAEKIFRRIEKLDLISWNTFIATCSHCNHPEKALINFKEMTNGHGVKPDDFTFTSALAACAALASLRHGKQIHCFLIRTRVIQDVGVGNALINMYAKCGCIKNADTVFSNMLNSNLVSWNTMIAGFGNHGLGRRAIDLFKKMKKLGVKPDSITFIGLLTACNHAGLVDEGQYYFDSMEETYGVSPNMEHFSCLIDLLGRAGRLHKAVDYMKNLPFGHDPVVLGSLLSASRLHGDVVMGEYLAKLLLKLQPSTTSPYVLLSNLYASDEMWDYVAEARKMLKGSGLKKEPAHSLIEVRGAFEKFTMGDLSHSMVEEINGMLKTLSWETGEVSSSHLILYEAKEQTKAAEGAKLPALPGQVQKNENYRFTN
ncbi:hypothetical protein K2173_017469 [Erythroxylum novogranatense]|uniref:Pentatricopeptide repeat-containing protein n=1 Tax=Erythroxylum novogranatense TaxID=1862640 RepID=A0AAV8TKN1_9ROSI|nr:hypothetical protein K2173_017469 [Erythroxylum novogranatense]